MREPGSEAKVPSPRSSPNSGDIGPQLHRAGRSTWGPQTRAIPIDAARLPVALSGDPPGFCEARAWAGGLDAAA